MANPGDGTQAGALPSAGNAGGHEFEHGADPSRHGQRRALGWALGLNAALLVLEVVGGVVFGSLALLADATHLVSDVAGLVIALAAVILTARPTSLRHSFGFARAEVLAAQVSAVLLIAAGAWILLESLRRLKDPEPVNGAGLAAIATVGLVVNLASAVLLHRAQGESLNMRASFVHLATDAAGSLASVVAGLLILAFSWVRADALASAAIAVLVLWAGWRLLRDTTHVLMEGTPRGMDTEQVRAEILAVDGVTDVHHLHLWNLASDIPTLSAHLVVPGDPSLRDAQGTADAVRASLIEHFGIIHMTLEIEGTPHEVPAEAGNTPPPQPSIPLSAGQAEAT